MRAAWDAALYAPGGFYLREQPADHFRTATHVSGDFAEAVLAVARACGTETVVDVGAGAGELLTALRCRDRRITLVGIEVRPRPAVLHPSVDWRAGEGDLAEAVADVASGPTLLIANELLDNVPCVVVELSDDGLREVEVEMGRSGVRERLGAPAEPAVAAWVESWWPLEARGQRAVVGLERDRLWRDLCDSVDDGVCVAVDYGHVRANRPWTESPTSYRRGRQHPARFDGRHDVTAHVAVDSVAYGVGGLLERQRDVLARTVPAPERPSIDLAHSDPRGYLRRLNAVGEHGELTARSGLGDFWWVVAASGSRADADPFRTMAGEGEVAR
jgi:hypothetical protein